MFSGWNPLDYFYNKPAINPQALGDLNEDWVLVEASYPTAYSKPLDEISYDLSQSLGKSSHDVFKGSHKSENSVHFVKHIDKPEMVYCEAFLGHIYSLALVYGVGRGYARHDDNGVAFAVSSKELSGFKTFGDEPLTREQLNNPTYRQRFIQLLATFFRMHEDDAHRKNITTDLKWWDSDCAFWDATVDIKGPRPNVDGVIRDPKKAFRLEKNGIEHEVDYDIIHFPNITDTNLWYFPSRTNVVSGLVSKNPWTSQEAALVQELEKDPQTLEICFEQYLDWILDLTPRFKHIAHLNIPADMVVPGTDKKIIDLYCETNKKIDAEYRELLAKMPKFQEYLEKNKFDILEKILVRCMVRNDRLEREKKQADAKFANQFDRAKVQPGKVINLFNELLTSVINKNKVFAYSVVDQSITGIKVEHDTISTDTANKLIVEAKAKAQTLIAIEKEHGTEEWERFVPAVEEKTMKCGF